MAKKCSCQKKKKKGGRMGSTTMGGFFDNVDLPKIAAQGVGFAGGALINPAIKRIPFVQSGLEKNEKVFGAGIGLAKVLAAVAVENYAGDGEFVSDAAFGFGLEGALEIASSLMPGLNLGVGNVANDYEFLGNVVEIDLDEISGSGDYRQESRLGRNELAGSGDHLFTKTFEEENVLAGDYAYELEYQ